MHVTFTDVHYDTVHGRFEGRVDIHREGGIFRYPCSLNGPKSMSEDQVRLGLAQHAMRMSDTPKIANSNR